MQTDITFIICLSDETTALTAGTDKFKFIVPYGIRLTGRPKITLSVGGSCVVDINRRFNDSAPSIFSGTERLSTAGSKQSSTSTGPNFEQSFPEFNDGAEISFDIDSVDTTARGLKVILYCTKML